MVKRIVVIDDSPTVRKTMEMVFLREGFSVTSYASGMEALRALIGGCHDASPDIIFVDLEVPHLDGYETTRWLRSYPPLAATTIILISGYESIGARVKGRLAGAQAYLVKPFTPQELLQVINASLRLSVTCSPG